MERNQPSEENQSEESLASLKEKYEEGAKIQAKYQFKFENVKFFVTCTPEDNRVNKNFKKELEEYKKLRNIDLTDGLNEKVYDTTKFRRSWFYRSTMISVILSLSVFMSKFSKSIFRKHEA